MLEIPKALGAVRPKAPLPLPAVRRGVMREKKGVRRPWPEARTVQGAVRLNVSLPLPAVRRGVML